ncbi:MAG: sulfite exporter TauE/SafE family protein [Rhodocyclaceae bacterium]|nr:sulfite exporter TauE/SafE family protein [Rhodocyclaceae bacterium]
MLLVSLGLLVGAVMGLTGAGGGILAVPALMFALDSPLAQVTPLALLAVAVSAAIGAWGGWRQGLVRYRAAALMSLLGVPFTALGVRLGAALSARQGAWLFVVLMLYIGGRQAYRLVRGQPTPAETLSQRPLDARSGRIVWSWRSGAVVAAIGAGTGLTTGLLGVGGGFIIVPLLQRFSNISIHGIVATALMVIALVSGGGALMALSHGAPLPPSIALPFVGAATLGMLAGRMWVRFLSPRVLQASFTVLVFVVACAVAVGSLTQ